MNVCQRPDYLEAIYDNDRRNRHPQSSCASGYNLPAEAFCTLPPSFIAQPFLTLDEHGELQLRDDDDTSGKCKGRCKKGPASAILDAADAQFGRPIGSSRMQPVMLQKQTLQAKNKSRRQLSDEAIQQLESGKQPWAVTSEATRRLYNSAGCEPCDLVLSCGQSWLGRSNGASCTVGGCSMRKSKPRPSMNQYGVPTLQMPNMDHVEYADGDGYEVQPLYFNRPISQLDAAGSNNPFLAQFAKYAFQQEKIRTIEQYGIGIPPFPKPCPPTPLGVAPRYDVPSREAQRAQPIVMDNQALFASDNCGCNRSTCAGSSGTTCTKCFRSPQSVAGIYARQSK